MAWAAPCPGLASLDLKPLVEETQATTPPTPPAPPAPGRRPPRAGAGAAAAAAWPSARSTWWLPSPPPTQHPAVSPLWRSTDILAPVKIQVGDAAAAETRTPSRSDASPPDLLASPQRPFDCSSIFGGQQQLVWKSDPIGELVAAAAPGLDPFSPVLSYAPPMPLHSASTARLVEALDSPPWEPAHVQASPWLRCAEPSPSPRLVAPHSEQMPCHDPSSSPDAKAMARSFAPISGFATTIAQAAEVDSWWCALEDLGRQLPLVQPLAGEQPPLPLQQRAVADTPTPARPPAALGADAAPASAPEELQLAAMGRARQENRPPLPCPGSRHHGRARCKPCAFFHTKGCENGENCGFCHLCEAGEKRRRQKVKIEKRRRRKEGHEQHAPSGISPAVPAGLLSGVDEGAGEEAWLPPVAGRGQLVQQASPG